MQTFLRELSACPVIAAVRDEDALERALLSPSPAVFLLGASILNIQGMVNEAHRAGKRVFIHMDLCEGLGSDTKAVDYCAERIRPDGLISTKVSLLRHASHRGLLTIQRLFIMDSNSIAHGVKLLSSHPPHMVEVLPGLLPKAIRMLSDALTCPVIAGGMVTDESEVCAAIDAGAKAVSTSIESLWYGIAHRA